MTQDGMIQEMAARIDALGAAMEHFDYVLRAVTASMTEISRRLPPDETELVSGDERSAGRVTTIAYKLPDGYGSLLVSIDKDKSEARIENRNKDWRSAGTIAVKHM